MNETSVWRCVLRNTMSAVGISCFIFCLSILITDLNNQGAIYLTDHAFGKMALGALLIGLGFGLPTFVYYSKKLSFPMNSLLYMGMGCTVMIVVAFSVGWIPLGHGPLPIITALAGELITACFIWWLSYLNYKRLARDMNRRLEQRKQ